MVRPYLFPGLGNSLGPLGTLKPSRNVLRRREVALGLRSTPAAARPPPPPARPLPGPLVAEAGTLGFRNPSASVTWLLLLMVVVVVVAAVVVRWYLRRPAASEAETAMFSTLSAASGDGSGGGRG